MVRAFFYRIQRKVGLATCGSHFQDENLSKTRHGDTKHVKRVLIILIYRSLKREHIKSGIALGKSIRAPLG